MYFRNYKGFSFPKQKLLGEEENEAAIIPVPVRILGYRKIDTNSA